MRGVLGESEIHRGKGAWCIVHPGAAQEVTSAPRRRTHEPSCARLRPAPSAPQLPAPLPRRLAPTRPRPTSPPLAPSSPAGPAFNARSFGRPRDPSSVNTPFPAPSRLRAAPSAARGGTGPSCSQSTLSPSPLQPLPSEQEGNRAVVGHICQGCAVGAWSALGIPSSPCHLPPPRLVRDGRAALAPRVPPGPLNAAWGG